MVLQILQILWKSVKYFLGITNDHLKKIRILNYFKQK